MIRYFKSALDQIKTEDELMKKTEEKLREAFLKQRNGEMIYFKKRSVFNVKKIAIAACSVILMCILAGGYIYYKTPVAYLSLDINPSIELGVNAFNNVVSATAYNDDGEAVLDGQDVTNTSVEDAVNKLIDSANEKGFIESDGSTIISITSETDDSDVAAKLESDAQKGAEDAIESNGSSAVIYKDNIALARRDEARKLGITPGKLNLIQKLQALDPTITVDQYKDAKVKDIMKKVYDLKKALKASDNKSTAANSDNKEADELQDIEKAVEQSEKNREQEKNKGSNVNKEQNREREQNQEQGNKIEVPASSKAAEPAKINANKNQQKNDDDKQNYVPALKSDDNNDKEKDNENKNVNTSKNSNGLSNGQTHSSNGSNGEGGSNTDDGRKNKD